MNLKVQKYLSKTINYKILLKYKNFFSNSDLISLNYFYWFYKTEYNHVIDGIYLKKKNSFSIKSFFLLSHYKTIKVHQVFFINSPFTFFIKKKKSKWNKNKKKIFFFNK